MIKNRSVFILGAGASVKPFEYPTGIELSKHITELLRPGIQNQLKNNLLGCEIQEHKLYEFRDAFLRSGKNSIDAFLEHRSDLVEIGRTIIAATLIGYEIEKKLFSFQNNWLRTLYNKLSTSFDEFGSNPISFVTFNYDRVVEQFLFTSLRNSYNRPEEECKTVLANIPIIHLHGQLDFLPWQGQGRPYSHLTTDRESIISSAAKIKIINEDITGGRDKDFARAKELIGVAQRIYLLGFGFHPLNIARIGIAEFKKSALATGVGLIQREKKVISSACNDKVSFVGGDCNQTVREFVQ